MLHLLMSLGMIGYLIKSIVTDFGSLVAKDVLNGLGFPGFDNGVDNLRVNLGASGNCGQFIAFHATGNQH
jgi:hypothetical protein